MPPPLKPLKSLIWKCPLYSRVFMRSSKVSVIYHTSTRGTIRTKPPVIYLSDYVGVMCVFLRGRAWVRWDLVTPGQGVGSPPAGADKDKKLDYLGGFPGVQKPYLQQKSSCSSNRTLISFWLSLMFIGHFNCTSNRRSMKPVDLAVTKNRFGLKFATSESPIGYFLVLTTTGCQVFLVNADSGVD